MGISSVVVASTASTASTVQTAQNGDALASIWSMLGGLALVIGLILFLAYMTKRLKLVSANYGGIKTISATPLGQKEKLVLVELEGQQYLLGVTSQQITLIDKVANANNVEQESFAEHLRQVELSTESEIKPNPRDN